MSFYKIKTCNFCRSKKISNTVNYITDVQRIYCTNCNIKYDKLNKDIMVLNRK